MNARFNIYRKMTASQQRNTGYLLLLFAMVSIGGCKKEDSNKGRPTTVQVLNALEDNVRLVGAYSDIRPSTFLVVPTFLNKWPGQFSFEGTSIHTTFYALPDTLEKDQPVFTKKFDVEQSKAYSLFLMGAKSQVDHLFIPMEYQPFSFEDSLTLCRIVNISNDQPVTVNLKGKAPGSLVSQLGYKQVSSFIALPVKADNKLYEVEIRDAATGDLLNTYNLKNDMGISGSINLNLYKYWSLVLIGKRKELVGQKLEFIRLNHSK